MRFLGLAALLAAIGFKVAASSFDYGLKPVEVADGVYVFEGRTEHFSRSNGGNIVNTGFIETDEGVIVIDTGPSRHYGEQMRARIAEVTDKDILRVFITHAHPDHFLGNQAFERSKIAATPATTSVIAQSGEDLSSNLYRLVGGWMEGTESVAPTVSVEGGDLTLGGRKLKLILASGHTDGDLAVLDLETGTLFAGDLVFLHRTATTPNADIARWLETLDRLEALGVKQIIPGHGPVAKAADGLVQTRRYLVWLRDALAQAASDGLDMNEAMQLKPPADIRKLAVFGEEFQRSVIHLYPALEEAAFSDSTQ